MKTNNNLNKQNTTEKNTTEKKSWFKENTEPRNIYANVEHKIEPIKIIYKYKNINRKNQYITYIYVGEMGKKYKDILSKIENLNLYDSLFGDLWMTKFFNIYHISAFVNKLEEKPELKTKLLKKYDSIWLNNFIEKFKKNVVFKKINYSFGDLVKFQYKIKMGKKLEKKFYFRKF